MCIQFATIELIATPQPIPQNTFFTKQNFPKQEVTQLRVISKISQHFVHFLLGVCPEMK